MKIGKGMIPGLLTAGMLMSCPAAVCIPASDLTADDLREAFTEEAGEVLQTQTESISLDENWTWASNSAIHTGSATLYRKRSGSGRNGCGRRRSGYSCISGLSVVWFCKTGAFTGMMQ